MSMSDNGVGQPQLTPAPQSQPQAAAPATPTINYVPVNPGTGQPVTQPAPVAPVAQTTDFVGQLRNEIATGLGIPLDQVPTNAAELGRVVKGGYAALQQIERSRQNNNALPNGNGQPPATAQAQPTTTNPLTEVPMGAGWQNLVQKNQQSGQWEPLHPNFAHVAQSANYNEGVQAARKNALSSGQLLPEQEQRMKEMMSQELSVEREKIRGEIFMDQYGKELYEVNQDGSFVERLNPQTMQQERVSSALGAEMRAAANELRTSGARFDSQSDLANMALKFARERVKLKSAAQAAQQTNAAPPQPSANRDLQDLLNNHQRSGTNAVTNSNAVNVPNYDIRSALRSDLQNLPENASYDQLIKAIGI